LKRKLLEVTSDEKRPYYKIPLEDITQNGKEKGHEDKTRHYNIFTRRTSVGLFHRTEDPISSADQDRSERHHIVQDDFGATLEGLGHWTRNVRCLPIAGLST